MPQGPGYNSLSRLKIGPALVVIVCTPVRIASFGDIPSGNSSLGHSPPAAPPSISPASVFRRAGSCCLGNPSAYHSQKGAGRRTQNPLSDDLNGHDRLLNE